VLLLRIPLIFLPSSHDRIPYFPFLPVTQDMSSDVAEVRVLLSALTAKVQENNSEGLFDAQVIGNALYGLQGMNVNSPEVLGLLCAITEKVRNSKEPLDAQAIGKGLYGLQGMTR
jgi:hypothetical protein